jgi:hypothetical protein
MDKTPERVIQDLMGTRHDGRQMVRSRLFCRFDRFLRRLLHVADFLLHRPGRLIRLTFGFGLLAVSHFAYCFLDVSLGFDK